RRGRRRAGPGKRASRSSSSADAAALACARGDLPFAGRFPCVPKLLHLIVACAENRVIGRDGRLPWKIPEDLKFFHDATAGQVCVLGRICFETWPGATRDGRQPIVVTHRPKLDGKSVPVAGSLPDALALAETLPGEIYICGGEQIYAETLAL